MGQVDYAGLRDSKNAVFFNLKGMYLKKKKPMRNL